MSPKENDNEIIELTDEELDEIFADDDFDNGEEDAVKSARFISPILTRMPRSSHAPAMPPRGSFLSMKMATSW